MLKVRRNYVNNVYIYMYVHICILIYTFCDECSKGISIANNTLSPRNRMWIYIWKSINRWVSAIMECSLALSRRNIQFLTSTMQTVHAFVRFIACIRVNVGYVSDIGATIWYTHFIQKSYGDNVLLLLCCTPIFQTNSSTFERQSTFRNKRILYIC